MMAAETKKSKHKAYEKNRRQKLNEELRANDHSNELLELCLSDGIRDIVGALNPIEHSSQSSDEDHAGHSDDEGEPSNKRVILRRTCKQLESLTDTEDGAYPRLYRGPADMENLVLEQFQDCLVIHFAVISGEVLKVMGNTENTFGLKKEDLVGKSLWDFVLANRRTQYYAFFKAHADALPKNTRDSSLKTLMIFMNSTTSKFVTMYVDGKFSHDADYETTTFLCLMIEDEKDDHLYDMCLTYISVTVDGIVSGAMDGCDVVFHRGKDDIKGMNLSDVLRTASCEPAGVIFDSYIQKIRNGEVDLEEDDTLSIDGVFQVIDREGFMLEPQYRVVMKAIAQPGDYERFELIGSNLLLFDCGSCSPPFLQDLSSVSSNSSMTQIMSWTST